MPGHDLSLPVMRIAWANFGTVLTWKFEVYLAFLFTQTTLRLGRHCRRKMMGFEARGLSSNNVFFLSVWFGKIFHLSLNSFRYRKQFIILALRFGGKRFSCAENIAKINCWYLYHLEAIDSGVPRENQSIHPCSQLSLFQSRWY